MEDLGFDSIMSFDDLFGGATDEKDSGPIQQ